MAQVRRIGIMATMVDPEVARRANPGQYQRPQAGQRAGVFHQQLHRPVRQVQLWQLPVEQRVHHRGGHAADAADQLDGGVCLSKYQFRGQKAVFC
jgi:hypothetical protein